MNVRVLIVLGLVCVTLAALSFARCEDPEVKLVEGTLHGIVAAVEAGDEETLFEYISADYGDRLGQDQRAAIRRAVHEVEHIPEVRIVFEDLDIDIHADTKQATASFRPVFEGTADPALKKHPKHQFERGKRLIVRLRKHDGLYVVKRVDIGYAFGAALK